MKNTIYCKTVAKGVQAFYVAVGSKSYFLFDQKYYVGVRNYFGAGRNVNELSAAAKNCNSAVRRTANKLPSYLKYIEKEYDVVIYDKRDNQKSKTYKKGNRPFAKVEDLINDYYNDQAVYLDQIA